MAGEAWEVEREALIDDIGSGAKTVAALLADLRPEEAARPVPGLEWTAAEVGAHLITVLNRLLHDMRRSATPEETAALNATCLEEFTERDPAALAERLATDAADVVAKYREISPHVAPDREFPFHGGTTITLDAGMAVVATEFIVHGYDIAAATGRRIEVDDDRVLRVMRASAPVAATWTKPGAEVAEPLDPATLGVPPFDLLLGLFGRIPPPHPAVAEVRERMIPL